MTPRAWYRFQNAADDPTVAELLIYGDIGQSWWDDDAVTAKQFLDDLKALSKAVTKIVVRVNSLGGSVFDAVAIANALRDQQTAKGRTVETVIDGIAASAASIVIMAGSTIRIADNALVMVHHPWTCACGNAAEMRKMADALDKIASTIVATYRWHSSLEESELVALMAAETWMDADEAIANGFATEKVEGLKAAASLDRSPNAKLAVPDKYRDRVNALLKPEEAPVSKPQPVAAGDVLKLCSDAGLDLVFARTLLEANATAEDVTARIATEKDTRAKAKTRSDEITALCIAAKVPENADSYIRGGMPVADVKTQLQTFTVKVDEARGGIDNSLDPNSDGKGKETFDLGAIYADLNGRPTKKEK